MQILEDLYIGNVRPGERMFKRNSQYAKALDEVVKAGDALTDSLTDKQKEFFEEYMTAQREVNVLAASVTIFVLILGLDTSNELLICRFTDHTKKPHRTSLCRVREFWLFYSFRDYSAFSDFGEDKLAWKVQIISRFLSKSADFLCPSDWI